MSGGHPRSTGTGDRDRTRSVFGTSPSVTMDLGDGVQDWNSESGEDDGDCDRCDDDVDLIETTSPVTVSVKSILHLPERNEDNTVWLFPEGIKPTSVLNKMKSETIATVHKRKKILVTEVTKNGWIHTTLSMGNWGFEVGDDHISWEEGRQCWSRSIDTLPEPDYLLPFLFSGSTRSRFSSEK